MLSDQDRIFTNLYGIHDPFLAGAPALLARPAPAPPPPSGILLAKLSLLRI